MFSYKELNEKVSALWPKCDFWPTENAYLPVNLDEFEQSQSGCSYPYIITRLFECEELADLFLLQYKMMRVNDLFNFEYDHIFEPRGERIFKGEKGQLYNYALGVAAGTKFQGKNRNHTVNILCCDDGLYLYDFQTRRTWKASKDDLLLKVRF